MASTTTTLPLQVPATLPGSECGEDAISSAYNGSHPVFRLMRACGWGPELMNLGYFKSGFGLIRIFNFLFRTLSHSQRQLVMNTIEFLNVKPEHRVLDVASGRGGTAYMIKGVTAAAEVCGIDLLPENVTLAKHLFPKEPGLSFLQGDAQCLPFANESFERVLCCEAAFHFPDRAAFLKEASRVLVPGGRLVIVDFVWRSPESRLLRDHPQMRIVRDIWQWDDLFTNPEYLAAGKEAGLRLAEECDWTRQVTTSLQRQMDFVLWMARTPFRKRLFRMARPLTHSFTDAEWSEVQISADAHRFANNQMWYKVFVFDKPKHNSA